MSDLAYADDIVTPSSSFSEMQGLLEAVYRHAAAIGMRINSLKIKVISALIPGEQHESLEDVDKFKYLASMFVANVSRINLACSAFSRLQSCLLSRR